MRSFFISAVIEILISKLIYNLYYWLGNQNWIFIYILTRNQQINGFLKTRWTWLFSTFLLNFEMSHFINCQEKIWKKVFVTKNYQMSKKLMLFCSYTTFTPFKIFTKNMMTFYAFLKNWIWMNEADTKMDYFSNIMMEHSSL